MPLMEHFYTIQGEGYHQGRAAYFIRLGGCDVGCTWCDVKESWDASAHPFIKIDTIVNEVKKSNATLCVITGGEPLLYNLDSLTKKLQVQGIEDSPWRPYIAINKSACSVFVGKPVEGPPR